MAEKFRSQWMARIENPSAFNPHQFVPVSRSGNGNGQSEGFLVSAPVSQPISLKISQPSLPSARDTCRIMVPDTNYDGKIAAGTFRLHGEEICDTGYRYVWYYLLYLFFSCRFC